MPADDFDLIRDRTTDDTEWLPDTKIQMYLDHHLGDWRLAAASCLDFMARDDIYEQYARGQIKVAKPLLKERANELRREAYVASGGTDVELGTLNRGDYGVLPTTTEYGIPYPAYGLHQEQGLMRTVKKRYGRSEV
jgi:hypothetical protein